jgi:hypothetical protein
MCAGVIVQIDQFSAFLNGLKGGFDHGFGRSGKRQDRAIVIQIRGSIEQPYAIH